MKHIHISSDNETIFNNELAQELENLSRDRINCIKYDTLLLPEDEEYRFKIHYSCLIILNY